MNTASASQNWMRWAIAAPSGPTRPLTDFWRVGKGYAAKLEANGLYTMGDIARCSIGQPTDYHNEGTAL